MLGRLNKKDLAGRAKKMKEVAQARLAKDLKLKVVAEAAPDPTDDKETYSGPVFKRRRKAATEPSKHCLRWACSLPTIPSAKPTFLL